MDVKEIFKYFDAVKISQFEQECRAIQEKKRQKQEKEEETVYDEYIGPFLENKPDDQARQKKKKKRSMMST